MESYIREAAVARGIDPDVAVSVAKSEGLNNLTSPENGYQSTVTKNGKREQSFGPFQLLDDPKKPGLGTSFKQKTGLDPRNPNTGSAQID